MKIYSELGSPQKVKLGRGGSLIFQSGEISTESESFCEHLDEDQELVTLKTMFLSMG